MKVLNPALWVLMLSLLLAVPAQAADRLLDHQQHQLTVPGRTVAAQQVREAILEAAAGRRWTVIADEPGKMTLRHAPRQHSVTVEVAYRDNGFTISYVASENMDYKVKRGAAYIHGNYNRWVANLVQDVRNSQKIWVVPAAP